jgi:hypothetical protein
MPTAMIPSNCLIDFPDILSREGTSDRILTFYQKRVQALTWWDFRSEVGLFYLCLTERY